MSLRTPAASADNANAPGRGTGYSHDFTLTRVWASAACEHEADDLASAVLLQHRTPHVSAAQGHEQFVLQPHVARVLETDVGQPLHGPTRRYMESCLGHDFGRVNVHSGSAAGEAARALSARAFAMGNDIFFGPQQQDPTSPSGRYLLAHELAHVIQHERAAGDPSPIIMRTPVEKVLKFSEKWLARRFIKTVSKHIAKHGREIAGKALHSVFRSPKKIKAMLALVIRDASALAAKHPSSTSEVIEEAGLKITRQATGTPGKVRWMIQREFSEAIGTRGEKILRVILDQSGRVVTAFPADRLAVIGLTVGGVALLESRTAQAAEHVQAEAQHAAEVDEKRASNIAWEEFIPFIGDIYGGSLNEGEDEYLSRQRWYQQIVKDVIDEVEFSEKRSLGKDERAELEDLVRAGIAAPLVDEDVEKRP